MRIREPLAVWLYGTKLAALHAVDNHVRLDWTSEGRDRWPPGTRILSDLLPIDPPGAGPHHRRVEVFFEGLLAEGNAREHMAFDAGVQSDDIFGMLMAYGRDTAGAVVIAPESEGSPDRSGSTVPVTPKEIGQLLRGTARNAPALGVEPGLQSNSLAGMQPKIVLVSTPQGWARSIGGYPSTHILKLAHPPESLAADVVHTEAACIELARRVGLTTVSAVVQDFDGISAIVVSRYDRHINADGTVTRLHQEDSAQALGINTAVPDRKFQGTKRMPSLALIARVLERAGSTPDRLLELTTFNLVVGNTDAHAKNISILRFDDGYGELAPAYDISMHLHHRSGGRQFSMNVNGVTMIDHIGTEDLAAEGVSWGLTPRRARHLVDSTLERTHAALAAIDHDKHPGVSEVAWRTVEKRAESLQGQTSNWSISAPRTTPVVRWPSGSARTDEPTPAGREDQGAPHQ